MRIWLHKLKEERGSGTFMMVLLTMPLLIACFGLAVDAAHGNYIKTQAQNNTQTATVGAVSQLNLNKAVINKKKAKKIAIELYTKNRANYENGVICAKKSDLREGESLQGGSCKWILQYFNVSDNGKHLGMRVREFSKNHWLHVMGMKSFTVKVYGRASVSYN